MAFDNAKISLASSVIECYGGRMNKNIKQTKQCLFCGDLFSTKANRAVYCSLSCRLAADSFEPSGGAGCWRWDGATDKDGYGRVRWQYVMYRAHVASWIAHNGAVPKGFCVLHKCDNPTCINPAHLWIGTVGDNNRDRNAKGRTKWNPNAGDNGRNAKRDSAGKFKQQREGVCGV